MIFAPAAHASECREYALLHDLDYFKSEYRWAMGRVQIKVWESPAAIRVIGGITPSARVEILEKSQDYYRVKAPSEQGGIIGWVDKAQIEAVFLQDPATQTHCEKPY